MIKVGAFALYGELAASTRYRLSQYTAGLADTGIELSICYLLNDSYLKRRFSGGSLPVLEISNSIRLRLGDLMGQARSDLNILYGELCPFMLGMLECASMRNPYIYDFDDAFYLKYGEKRSKPVQWLLGNKFDTIISGAAAVTAGSAVLAGYARNYNDNVVDLPTVVDVERYLPDTKSRNGDVFTIGWIGSPSTAPYLEALVSPLSIFGKERPTRLVVIGGKAPYIPNVEIVELPWSEDTEVALINSFDVGVMPLPDSPWARGKCAFKLIQYMACSVPVVASPVGANVDVVGTDCGILADTSEQWLAAFRTLSEDRGLRERLGECGRQRVIDHYSLQHNLPILAKLIHNLAAGHR